MGSFVRALTESEKSLAREAFGAAIDLAPVRLIGWPFRRAFVAFTLRDRMGREIWTSGRTDAMRSAGRSSTGIASSRSMICVASRPAKP